MYKIRNAENSDIPFLIDAILEAESFAGRSTYEIAFGLSKTEIQNILKQIFDEEIENQEVCVLSFAVVEFQGKVVSACSAWIEALEGIGSGFLKSSALGFLLPSANLQTLEVLSEVGIQRTIGAIQLESFFTLPEFRGRGLSNLLIDYQIYRLKNGKTNLAQIIAVSENQSAIRAYQKSGFVIAETTKSENLEIVKILGGKGKTLLEKKV